MIVVEFLIIIKNSDAFFEFRVIVIEMRILKLILIINFLDLLLILIKSWLALSLVLLLLWFFLKIFRKKRHKRFWNVTNVIQMSFRILLSVLWRREVLITSVLFLKVLMLIKVKSRLICIRLIFLLISIIKSRLIEEKIRTIFVKFEIRI